MNSFYRGGGIRNRIALRLFGLLDISSYMPSSPLLRALLIHARMCPTSGRIGMKYPGLIYWNSELVIRNLELIALNVGFVTNVKPHRKF